MSESIRNTDPGAGTSLGEADTPPLERAEADIERVTESSGDTLNEDDGEERAAGTVESPIPPDPGPSGDRHEEGARRGGPIDVTPTREGGSIE
ncbi:hypothetical protein M0638_09435 [Roseomonas sp. NAR14]|uniref:Uncharacterized protein n=1 Tax=Roseomonas acroporae TaxID=2937791 RepID=A0A9X2BTH2_9PROT|nr:hypothetical protein [Roseomonas acroporae]MCK8784603.1 hypothetical protein [Roseomonas acroporae]